MAMLGDRSKLAEAAAAAAVLLILTLVPPPAASQDIPMPVEVLTDKDDSGGPLDLEEVCGNLPIGGDPSRTAMPVSTNCSKRVRA